MLSRRFVVPAALLVGLALGCVDLRDERASSQGGASGSAGQGGDGSAGGGGLAGGGSGGNAGPGGDGGSGGGGGAEACGELRLEFTAASGSTPHDLAGYVAWGERHIDLLCLDPDESQGPERFPSKTFRCESGTITVLQLAETPDTVNAQFASRDGRFAWSGGVQPAWEPAPADGCARGVASIEVSERPAAQRAVEFALRLAPEAAAPIYVISDNTRFEGWLRVLDERGQEIFAFGDQWHDQCSNCTYEMSEGQWLVQTRELAPGEQAIEEWTGRWAMSRCWYGTACDLEQPIDSGPHVARFCWGTDSLDDWPFVLDGGCADVPFVVPEDGTVRVEHVVTP